jgi:hypothetical protein
MTGAGLRHKATPYIIMYYSVGLVVSLISAIGFYELYGVLPSLIRGYQPPYELKRLALSLAISASIFQVYLVCLGALFKRERFFFAHSALTMDEAKKVRDSVTILPWWISIFFLYILAILTALL